MKEDIVKVLTELKSRIKQENWIKNKYTDEQGRKDLTSHFMTIIMEPGFVATRCLIPVRVQIFNTIQALYPGQFSDFSAFNDDPETTIEDVIEVIDISLESAIQSK